ncbi:MAG: hypothetical protein K6T66_08415 [Peptococcaceae bacterium]|nr:hypothetical protein [Peptococcaceae bacterium]
MTNLPRRKGVGLLFFRLVNARYKDRQYSYLKLLESRRQGDKVRQKQLVNLSVANQLPADRIKPLFEDLSGSIGLYKEISELLPPSCRHLKTSYLLALENSFKISQHTRNNDLGEIIQADRRIKHTLRDRNALFELILEKVREYGIPKELIGWVEDLDIGNHKNNLLACFLLDSSGFPLKYMQLSREKGEEVKGLQDLKIKNMAPEFFLAPACERLYNAFRLTGHKEKEKGCVFKEIYFVRQLTGRTGKTELGMERLLIYGPESAMRDENISKALLAVTALKDHLAYVINRIGKTTGEYSMPPEDLVCTYFLSLFFKRIFDEIMIRHNIQQCHAPTPHREECKQ